MRPICVIEKFVALGTICAYPKFTPGAFKERISGTDIQKKPTPLTDWPKK